MSETQFNETVDTVLLAIEQQVEAAGSDIDCETAAGILTLEFDDDSKIIINRQTPNREIWVAARSGGFHFRQVGGVWVDTRSGAALHERLRLAVREQGGDDIEFILPGAK